MRINKGLIITIISLLIFSSFPLTGFAEENTDNEVDGSNESTGMFSTKDEVIYGRLDGHGKINNVYVVNTFHTTKAGKIVDYGDYADIRNLTDLSAIDQTNGNEIHFQADEGDFYYQGELTNLVLPWDISIDYVVDGKKVNTSELAGQTGALEIQITTTQNKTVDSTFFENYLMQISISFDPTIFSNIQAPKGTEANEGKNKLVTFSVMPDTEEELIISADVEKLEMDPINISAIPANIAIENPDIGDMKDEMQELADAISEINSGVADLSDGISELNNGTTKLSNGSSDYSAGISELDQGSGELVNGSKEIRNALQQISKELEGGAEIPDLGNMTELPDLGNMTELPDGLKEIAEGLRGSAVGLEDLSEGYSEAYDALDGAIKEIPNGDDDGQYIQEQIGALYQSDADPDFVDQLTKTYEAAQKIKHTHGAVSGGFTAVTGALENIAGPLYAMADQLETIATGIESAMENLDQLDALTDLQKGLSTLASEYSAFHNGLVDYTEGVHSLATNYQNLDSGIKELSSGTAELADGADQLYDGTSELESATNDIPEEMQSEIDKLLEEYDNKDFKPVSFVSDKNENVDVVQFVLQTESIEIEKPEEIVEAKEEEKGVWERFLDLFR